MSVTGNNLFMLEVIVYRVTLTDQIQIHNTCPVCVCFRFPGLVELAICEGGFCADGKVGGGEILMTNGKSCLLTVSTADLCRTARDFCAIISVNRRVLGEQQMRYVAQTKLEFDRTFVDVILNPIQDQRSRKLKKVLPLYDNGRQHPVGTVEVFVRLTSQGDLVVTHFNRAPDSDKYQYKAINEFVPTQSTMDCTERIMLNPKKICKHKTSCRNKRPKVKQDPDSYCGSEMKRANCVMTMMEKLTALYKEVKTISQPQGGEVDADGDQQGKPCMFDLNCPASRCPFRTGQAANAFVGHLIDGTRPGNVGSSNNRLKNHEIVDDADLFILNVGRVDPCRVVAPLVYKDGCSQCFETDFSTVLLPPPPPVQKKIKKGKKSKNSKKGKKAKK
ncbi:unnamed protein product [Macrosiphum euphorbiae]|uniref:Uncharacterized protein n=1 Tax=Macrosiphum euphorbiae TaxID=13131 RepID=A0AAV0X5F7_9HEMI|nr:unnamed protein product [Macrosiphum euphorbiae]